jgi:ketose-bisphosphate aldolase
VLGSKEIMKRAYKTGVIVPAFNVPYLPMVEPVTKAVVDTDSFGFIATARLEWYKFEAQGLGPVHAEYQTWKRPKFTRLHLDHVPVIDEDQKRCDYAGILKEAIVLGYDSVMIDGSRLGLDDNMEATAEGVAIAHAANRPCEAELGAVLGHEEGPPPPYEELFESGEGFTRVDEAERFVKETGCDWLSVAVGNIHGAVSEAFRDQKKPEARLNLEHLEKLRDATGIPLVLHGGSGINKTYIQEGMKRGIAKINIGTEIRQAYEQGLRESGNVKKAQEACYKRTRWVIEDFLAVAGKRKHLIQ